MTIQSLMGIGPFKYLGHPNTHVLRSGGGGGGDNVTKVDSVPDWYKPYIQRVAGPAVNAFEQGLLGQVAELNPYQSQALSSTIEAGNLGIDNYGQAQLGANKVAEIAQYGELQSVPAISSSTQAIKDAALYDANKAYSGLNQGINNANAIGGARAGLLKADHERGVARQFADLDYQDYLRRQGAAGTAAQQSISNAGALNQLAGQPAQQFGAAGAALQDQTQAEADATYKGLSQIGSILSGTPQATQSAIKSSGGK